MDDAAARLGTNNQYTFNLLWWSCDNEEVMQLNFVVRQGNSAITLSFVNPSPMGEGFQLLETLLQLHKLCSYIICSIKYTCTIYQFTQKIPHTQEK